MREALRSAEDLHLTDAELDDLFDDLGVKDSGGLHTVLSYDVLHDVLTSGRYRRTDDGRYFVLLSLAEAETIRMIMHLRQGRQVVEPNSSPSPNPSPNPSPSPSPNLNPGPDTRPNPCQVEFYFSEANLTRDPYMRRQIESDLGGEGCATLPS